jgi:hypothetical protein
VPKVWFCVNVMRVYLLGYSVHKKNAVISGIYKLYSALRVINRHYSKSTDNQQDDLIAHELITGKVDNLKSCGSVKKV